MNNELRQEVLKELNYLLREQATIDYTNVLGDVSTIVGKLDGWVDAVDIKDVKTILTKYAGKNILTRKGSTVPAIQYIAWAYSRDENGDKIEDDISSITTRTMSTDGMDALDDVKEIISKYLPNGTPLKEPASVVPNQTQQTAPEATSTISATVAQETSPQAPAGTVGDRYSRSFGCKDVDSVKAWQGFLGVNKDGKIGNLTISTAMKKDPSLNRYNLKEYMAVDANGNPTKEALNLQQSLCNYLAKPEVKKYHEDNQAKQQIVKKVQPAATPATTPAAMKQAEPAQEKVSNRTIPAPMQESKFYNNKKLNEAKQLFNKLMKNL